MLQECLYLIYKSMLTSKLLEKNQKYDKSSFNEFIDYDLFFGKEN